MNCLDDDAQLWQELDFAEMGYVDVDFSADFFSGDNEDDLRPLAIANMMIIAMHPSFNFCQLRLDEFGLRTQFIRLNQDLVGFHYNRKGFSYFFYKKKYHWYIEKIIYGELKASYQYVPDEYV